MSEDKVDLSMNKMQTRADRIILALEAALEPERLEVVDESHLHAGHSGWREGGETHYRIDVIATRFQGRSRVERHRMVNAAVAAEFDSGLHALAIAAKTPEEAALAR